MRAIMCPNFSTILRQKTSEKGFCLQAVLAKILIQAGKTAVMCEFYSPTSGSIKEQGNAKA